MSSAVREVIKKMQEMENRAKAERQTKEDALQRHKIEAVAEATQAINSWLGDLGDELGQRMHLTSHNLDSVLRGQIYFKIDAPDLELAPILISYYTSSNTTRLYLDTFNTQNEQANISQALLAAHKMYQAQQTTEAEETTAATQGDPEPADHTEQTDAHTEIINRLKKQNANLSELNTLYEDAHTDSEQKRAALKAMYAELETTISRKNAKIDKMADYINQLEDEGAGLKAAIIHNTAAHAALHHAAMGEQARCLQQLENEGAKLRESINERDHIIKIADYNIQHADTRIEQLQERVMARDAQNTRLIGALDATQIDRDKALLKIDELTTEVDKLNKRINQLEQELHDLQTTPIVVETQRADDSQQAKSSTTFHWDDFPIEHKNYIEPLLNGDMKWSKLPPAAKRAIALYVIDCLATNNALTTTRFQEQKPAFMPTPTALTQLFNTRWRNIVAHAVVRTREPEVTIEPKEDAQDAWEDETEQRNNQ